MIVETVLSLLVVSLIWSVVSSYIKRRNMPPGPFPFPFVGNFPQMLRYSADPFSKLAEIYGDIYTLVFPTGNTVVLNTASLVREARLQKRGDLVGKTEESFYPLNEMLGEAVTTGDFSPKYVFRKKVLLTALHSVQFAGSNELSAERAKNAAKNLLEEIDLREEKPFSPKKLLDASMLAEIWKMMTTTELSLSDPVVKLLTEFAELVAKQALKGAFYKIIPFGSYLPSQFNRDIKRAVEIRNTLLPPEFKAHLETYQPNVIRDLTDGLIGAFKKELQKQNGKDVGSLDDIPVLMIDVFFAGAETTSSTLAWFLLYMALYKDVQEKIRKEIDLVMEKDSFSVIDNAKNMPYLQATLCEVMRIACIVPTIGTSAIRDTTIAGYHIPKGTFVSPNIKRVHHDEREWPEPDVFKPERFLDSEENFVGWTKLHGFMPFGLGRRECTGQSVARMMLLTFASTLLHRYEIILPDGAEKPTTKVPRLLLVLKPQDYKIVAKKRF